MTRPFRRYATRRPRSPLRRNHLRILDTDTSNDRSWLLNGDDLHSASQRLLRLGVGAVNDGTFEQILDAIALALACQRD